LTLPTIIEDWRESRHQPRITEPTERAVFRALRGFSVLSVIQDLSPAPPLKGDIRVYGLHT